MVVLRPLRADDEVAATRAHEELAAEGFAFLIDRDRAASFADYVALLERQRRGLDEHPDRVPATFLVADDDGEADGALVGRVSIRHELDDFLRREGGHVGYAVRPAHRWRGHATRMLRHAVAYLADLGVASALVTCDEDNVASRVVIERCGGTLEDTVRLRDGRLKRRYRIATG